MPDPGEASFKVISWDMLGAAGLHHSANEAADVMSPGDPNETAGAHCLVVSKYLIE
ncbi:hypothetical protein SAMN05216420_101482 [Nitrosospira sp. Nl5]|uniref:hypothetical protein n=1 Tax=Nitrosospira sp. Nl5 TaxID=200120 RepID=UPI000885A873|nr:hypothetical protein [Nitrosospira sp. Nl5]SCX96664.1 hypothetical protein SAMN05216420_101482 [Nitrosospira sp. Nl5]